MLNIPRKEADSLPFGELGDLIACWQISKGAMQKGEPDDEEMIPDIL